MTFLLRSGVERRVVMNRMRKTVAEEIKENDEIGRACEETGCVHMTINSLKLNTSGTTLSGVDHLVDLERNGQIETRNNVRLVC